jgi:hypothetical protein
MNPSFSKLFAAGTSYVVVNATGHQVDDWSGLAARLTSHHAGVGADQVVVSNHRGAGTFDVHCFGPDGVRAARVDDNAIRCAAMAARTRYGVRGLTVVSGGHRWAVRLDGGYVGLRTNFETWRYELVVHVVEGEVLGGIHVNSADGASRERPGRRAYARGAQDRDLRFTGAQPRRTAGHVGR